MNNQRGKIPYFDRDVIGVDGFTWNPTTGCTFGCPECWAREVAQTRLYPAAKVALKKASTQSEINKKIGIMEAYRTFTPTLHPERLDEPAHRKKSSVIGVCFMGDLFDPTLSDEDFYRVTIAATQAQQHTFVFLTKRPDLMAAVFGNTFTPRNLPWGNWFLGFSARNQAEFDAGWPHMAKLAAAGWKVWVSLEPMQGPVDIEAAAYTGECVALPEQPWETLTSVTPDRLSTVILGAQSGKNAVPLQKEWVESVQKQCAAADIPFMFKQDNSTGKVVSLPELDGVQHTATAWSNKGC